MIRKLAGQAHGVDKGGHHSMAYRYRKLREQPDVPLIGSWTHTTVGLPDSRNVDPHLLTGDKGLILKL